MSPLSVKLRKAYVDLQRRPRLWLQAGALPLPLCVIDPDGGLVVGLSELGIEWMC